MQERNKQIIGFVLLNNIISLICFTVLAVIFNKWWIVLFSALFMSILKPIKAGTYRICDGCGKHSPYGKDINDGLKKAKEAGWTHIVKGDKDYCPECASTMEELFHEE